MTDVTGFFPTPPPIQRPSASWKAEAESLRENPGQFRRIAVTGTRSLITRVKKGFIPAFRPEGHYTAVFRNGEVWASYVGPDDVDTGSPASPDRDGEAGSHVQ